MLQAPSCQVAQAGVPFVLTQEMQNNGSQDLHIHCFRLGGDTSALSERCGDGIPYLVKRYNEADVESREIM